MHWRYPVLAFIAAWLVASPAGAADKTADADLDHLSAALNAIHTLKADFTQIDPSGDIEQGQVFIDKPGKMRFQYQPPSPLLVVSDGLDVAVFNSKLNTADRYPLSATPLNIILSDHVNLKENRNVIGIEHQPGALIVKARSNDRRINGNISIVFSDPGFELRQWTTTDAQGLATTVTLRNVQT
ncbi:MAG TPA: outer membrane lipoprotein carrier protein LolA, partial [Rhizomicrobium sp.]